MLPLSVRSMFICAAAVTGARLRSKKDANATAEITLDLPNWMGQLEDIIGNATILDLTLPGTHDTMTAELTEHMPTGFVQPLETFSFGKNINKLIHKITPHISGPFIKQHSQNQGLKVTEQLDSGIRFLDFRILYSKHPSHMKEKGKDWYNLHGTQSKEKSTTYLKEVRTWLDAHPKEIIVFWITRHGNNEKNHRQWQGTTPQQQQQFFEQVQEIFNGKILDTREANLNTTKISTLWEHGTQVVWFSNDYDTATGNSPLAIDANDEDGFLLNNVPDFWPPPWVPELQHGAAIRPEMKKNGTFWLMGMAMRGYSEMCFIAVSAVRWYKKNSRFNLTKGYVNKKCARCLMIPGVKDYCPASLQDLTQLTNYYVQRDLENMYEEGASNPAVDFPNAIYIDGVDYGGLLRTGTKRVNPMPGNPREAPPSDHETTGYAFAATLIGTNVRRFCREGKPAACAKLQQAVDASRATGPLQLWSDPAHGRLETFPETTDWVQPNGKTRSSQITDVMEMMREFSPKPKPKL